MRKIDTKALVEASIFTALAAIIMIISAYVPFFSFLGVILWPMPITLLTFKYDLKLSLLSLSAVLLIVSGITGPLTAIPMGMKFGIPAVVLGFCLKRKYSPFISVMAMTLAMFLAYVAMLRLSVLITGVDIVKQFYDIIDESFRIYSETAKGLGMTDEQLNQSLSKGLNPETLKESIRLTLPGMLAVASLMGSYFNYYFTGVIFKRLRIDIKRVKPIEEWYISTNLSFGLFFVTVVSWLLNYFNVKNGEVVFSSIFTIFSFAFIINGFALIAWFLKTRGVSRRTRIIILVLLYFIGVSQIVFILGIADYAMDIRKINPTRRRIPPGE